MLTPPQVKPPLWVAQHKTTEGLQREGRDMAAATLVAQEVCQRWQVCSHSIRRVVCPPGSMPGGRSLPPPPPPPAPERTKPQWRGRTRSALRDPTRLAANFHSSGWRKDLEHILKVYYKYSVDYFTEGDWSRIKEWFFDLFLQHKKEALEVKEAHPLVVVGGNLCSCILGRTPLWTPSPTH